jgi:hypothetical protein
VTQTIVLHIGYSKTGTSSLQWFLNARREELRQQDVYYPLVGQDSEHAHHKLALSLSANPYEAFSARARTALLGALEAEIEQCGCRTVVLSSELFIDRVELVQGSAEFTRLLAGRNLRVICVLRSQETFLDSLYRQLILDPAVRLSEAPETFLKTYGPIAQYHTYLTAWTNFVGKDKLLPIIYEQAVHSEGLIRRFCRALGVATSHLSAAETDVWRNATRDSPVVAEIMRVANRCPDVTPEQRLDVLRHAMTFAESIQHVPLPRRLLSDDHLALVRSLLGENNRRLAEDFVHQPLDGFWFPLEAPGRTNGADRS